MKTSNRLLTLLLALSLLAMVGSGFSLKAKFDKINRNDPYWGYSKESLKPFKYVKLRGNFFGLTQIEPGQSFEIRIQDMRNYALKPKIGWKVLGDTLFVSYANKEEKNFEFNEHIYSGLPNLYIVAPQLAGIASYGITNRLKGWHADTFSVFQSGNGIQIGQNHFKNLILDARLGARVRINAKNEMGHANINLKDSSDLSVEKDIFRSFQIEVDSSTHISLPGSLVKKMADF